MQPTIFCSRCKYLTESINNRVCCYAFPQGIPHEILFAGKLHNEVLPNQEGNYIFSPKDGYEDFVPTKHIPERDNNLPSLSLSDLLKKLRESREKDENNE